MSHDLPHISVGEIPIAKLKKALKTGRLHLSDGEMSGGSLRLHLHPVSYKKAAAAKGKKKGVHLQITRHEMDHCLKRGGSIWSSIGSFLSKNATPILDTLAGAATGFLGPQSAPVVGSVRDLARAVTGKGAVKPIMSGSGAKKSASELREFRVELLKKARDAKKIKGGSFLQAGY